MPKTRVGVIGVGNMGKNHVRVYSQLAHLVKFAGIYDIDPVKCQYLSKQYQTKAFTTPEELIAEVDAVSIAVPSTLHFAYAKLCLEKGVHVLVEKPIAPNLEQALKMINLAQEKSCVLQVGQVERYNPATQELKKILANEEPVALSFFRLSPYDPRIGDTDVVMDLMIHDLDVLLYLTGSKLTVIQALGLKAQAGGLVDYAVAQCLTGSNQAVTLTASRITEKRIRQIFISTKKSFIEMDYIDRKITISRRTNLSNYLNGMDLRYSQESLIETVLVPNIEPLLAEILDFIGCIKSKQAPQADGIAGLAALFLAKKIQDHMCTAVNGNYLL